MFKNQPTWMPPFIIALAANALLALIPILSQRDGTRFMPTPGYVATAELPAVTGGVILSIATILIAVSQMPNVDRSSLFTKPVRSIPGLLAVLAFVGYPFYINMLVTLPMAATTVWSRPTMADYRVQNDHPRTRGRRVNCQPAVSLSGMPFLYSRACHLPEPVRDALNRGDTIRLIGSGNGLGVHYNNAQAFPARR